MRQAVGMVAAAVLAAGGAWSARAQTLTPAQVLDRAVAAMQASDSAREQYAWHERDILSTINRDGKPPTVRSDETDAVSEVEGTEYSRVIARDGKPLDAKDEAKEARKAARFIRDHSSPQAEAKNARELAKQREHWRQLLAAIPQAFEVAFAPDPTPAPCACYVVTLTPRPGYRARDKNLKLLFHVAATVWIQRADFAVVRARFHFLQPVSVGWVLAKIEPGSEFELQNAPVDGHWFEQSLTGTLVARVLLVKKFHLRVDDSYTDYRKFGVTSRVVAAVPVIRH